MLAARADMDSPNALLYTMVICGGIGIVMYSFPVGELREVVKPLSGGLAVLGVGRARIGKSEFKVLSRWRIGLGLVAVAWICLGIVLILLTAVKPAYTTTVAAKIDHIFYGFYAIFVFPLFVMWWLSMKVASALANHDVQQVANVVEKLPRPQAAPKAENIDEWQGVSATASGRARQSKQTVCMCYSATGAAQAESIAAHLESRGSVQHTFVDCNTIEVIGPVLSQSDVLCIVLTPGIMADSQCQRLMSTALELGVHIVGVMDKQVCIIEDEIEAAPEDLKRILFQTEFLTFRTIEHEAEAMMGGLEQRMQRNENDGPWDVYVCHTHRTGGEQARALSNLLVRSRPQGLGPERRQDGRAKNKDGEARVWLDKDMPKTDIVSMEDGVRNSQIFMILLTEGIMGRPYCIKEMRWAVLWRSAPTRVRSPPSCC